MSLGDLLGKQFADKEQMKPDLTNQDPETVPIIVLQQEKVKVRVKKIVGKTRSYNTANNVLIWGHPTKGTWGSFKWGTDSQAWNSWTTQFTQEEDN